MFSDFRPTVRVHDKGLHFSGELRHLTPREVLEAISEIGDVKQLHFDFSAVEAAFPIAIVPLVAICDRLRVNTALSFSWPIHQETSNRFSRQGWQELLAGRRPEPPLEGRLRGPRAIRYTDASTQTQVVSEMTDLLMSKMRAPQSVIHGLEWSLNEITDNVLNHAETPLGGIVQMSLRPRNNQIEFIVVDAGQGILRSLSKSHDVKTDREAIEEAIKHGVTSGSGQGYGLAGTIRVALGSGGLVRVTSGDAQIYLHDRDGVPQQDNHYWPNFSGTIVQAIIGLEPNFSLEEALNFSGRSVFADFGLIDARYQGDKEFVLKLSDETTGFGSRESGQALRTKVSNLLTADGNQKVRIDWEGIPVVASSFADEFIGKLYMELGPIEFGERILNQGMEDLVRKLVDQAIRQRIANSTR